MKWGLVILGMLAELNGFMIESSAESVMHQIYGAIYIGIGAMLWCSAAIMETISPTIKKNSPPVALGSPSSREEFYRRQGTPPPDPERDKQDATIMSYLDDPPPKKK